MIHIIVSVARVAMKLQIAKERRQKEIEEQKSAKKWAEHERLEAVREADDPVYRAQKEASRLAQAKVWAKQGAEAERREARLNLFRALCWLFWLTSVVCFLIVILSAGLSAGNPNNGWAVIGWFGGGALWVAALIYGFRYEHG